MGVRGLCLLAALVQGLSCAAAGELSYGVDGACASPSGSLEPGSPAPEFRVGPAAVIMTTNDMNQTGLMFPDGTLGVIKGAGREHYVFWAASGNFGGVRKVATLPAGTYRFEGSLAHFEPAAIDRSPPTPALLRGSMQPSPDGSDFDRDYAGGGPTYAFALQKDSVVLLQIYHGEFDAVPGMGQLAYGGSGLALSRDRGKTFQKIGQILAPHVSRADFFNSASHGGMWADASMIEADARGHRVSPPGAGATERERYVYLIFTDHHLVQEPCTGLSLARIRKSDLLAALSEQRAPEFRKWRAGDFSEPGLGGDSTPVIAARSEYINSPSIAYDQARQHYVLAYQVNQKEVRVSRSDDLLHWSAPQTIAARPRESSLRLFYPSLVGGDGDPAILGGAFYVYFLERERDARGGFSNPRLLRERLEDPNALRRGDQDRRVQLRSRGDPQTLHNPPAAGMLNLRPLAVRPILVLRTAVLTACPADGRSRSRARIRSHPASALRWLPLSGDDSMGGADATAAGIDPSSSAFD
jgi:hypothetical protein